MRHRRTPGADVSFLGLQSLVNSEQENVILYQLLKYSCKYFLVPNYYPFIYYLTSIHEVIGKGCLDDEPRTPKSTTQSNTLVLVSIPRAVFLRNRLQTCEEMRDICKRSRSILHIQGGYSPTFDRWNELDIQNQHFNSRGLCRVETIAVISLPLCKATFSTTIAVFRVSTLGLWLLLARDMLSK